MNLWLYVCLSAGMSASIRVCRVAIMSGHVCMVVGAVVWMYVCVVVCLIVCMSVDMSA